MTKAPRQSASNDQPALRDFCATLFTQPDRLDDALCHHLSRPLHVAPHRHRDLFQLDIIIDCGGRAWSQDRWVDLRGTTLIATYPGEEHGYRLRPANPTARNIVLKFRLPKAAPALASRLFPPLLTGLSGYAPLIDALDTVTRLAGFQAVPSPLLLAKLTEAVSLWPKSRQTPPASQRHYPQTDDGRTGLSLAIQMIEQRLDAPPSAAELARTCHLSLRHFTRRFTDLFGLTPHQFITARRLERARQLLREKQLTISQTAQRLGFPSLAGFSRWFTQNAKRSPTNYQNHPEHF